jgi:hypothetical protein
MKPWKWAVVVLVLLALGIVLILAATTYDGYSKSDQAVMQAANLTQVCEAYRVHPNSGKKYPATLADLASPPFGGSSFLKYGKDDLIDPWGNPFKYAIVPNEKGEPEVYVWTERIVDEKLMLLGAKRTADGETHVFGR